MQNFTYKTNMITEGNCKVIDNEFCQLNSDLMFYFDRNAESARPVF